MFWGRSAYIIGEEYLSRQALTSLRLARLTKDRQIAAHMAAKAADMQARFEDAPLSPEMRPTAPDIQPEP